MSKRLIDTGFWTDEYVFELPPYEKLMFAYMISNPLGNIAGIMPCHAGRFGFDTRIPADLIPPILQRFCADGKAIALPGRIALPNWNKHQARNPSVKKGIVRELSTLCIQDVDTLRHAGYSLPPSVSWESVIRAGKDHDSGHAVDTLYTGSIHAVAPNYTKLNHTNKPKGLISGGVSGPAPDGSGPLPLGVPEWKLTGEEMEGLCRDYPAEWVERVYSRHQAPTSDPEPANPVAFMRMALDFLVPAK